MSQFDYVHLVIRAGMVWQEARHDADQRETSALSWQGTHSVQTTDAGVG